MTYTHGHIIPLIGGMVLGAKDALGNDPSWIASWENTFKFNDSYCLKYFDSTPYFNIDNSEYPTQHVDIVTSLPPCAGLSSANTTKNLINGKNPRGCNAPSNIHMLNAAEFAMDQLNSKVFIAENAPTLYSKTGEVFADRINNLAKKYNYSMSLIKTSTIYHGIPQNRSRSFFILWRGEKAPVLKGFDRPKKDFHEFLRDNSNIGDQFVSKGKPSDDPYWQYILSKTGLTHSEAIREYASIKQTTMFNIISSSGWLDDAISNISNERANKWLRHCKNKKSQGLNVLDGSARIGYKSINALIWQSFPRLMHPYEDRWLTTKEGLALMGFPSNFTEVESKNFNVISQNCPACTARDWISEIKEALDGNREWIETNGKILRQNNDTSKEEAKMKVIWKI